MEGSYCNHEIRAILLTTVSGGSGSGSDEETVLLQPTFRGQV